MRILLACLLSLLAFSSPATEPASKPRVLLQTALGDITLELDPAVAPATTANFLRYVDEGFYRKTLFHRVIPGFMTQGGGFSSGMTQKPTHDPITNESANGLQNQRGTIAMARTQDPDSATAQFFINLVDNAFLNGSKAQPGYAVFGRVIAGMEVVDRIAGVATGRRGPHGDVPLQDIEILDARRLP